MASIDFASYGHPTGYCQHYSYDQPSVSSAACNADNSHIIVSQGCYLENNCDVHVNVSDFTFLNTQSKDYCTASNTYHSNQLYVQVTCLRDRGNLLRDSSYYYVHYLFSCM